MADRLPNNRWVLPALVGGVAALCLGPPVRAQTVEIWLFEGEVELSEPTGKITLRPGSYAGCGPAGCQVRSLSQAPPPPLADGTQRSGALPAEVLAAIEAASTVSEIAELVAAHGSHTGEILTLSADLGIAAPNQVVQVLAPTLGSTQLMLLIFAAVEEFPEEADLIVGAAAQGSGTDPQLLAITAVQALEASGLTQEQIGREAAEVLLALGGSSALAIAQAIADATSDPNDSPQSLMAQAEDELVTDTADTGPARTAPQFLNLPSESQNLASPN